MMNPLAVKHGLTNHALMVATQGSTKGDFVITV